MRACYYSPLTHYLSSKSCPFTIRFAPPSALVCPGIALDLAIPQLDKPTYNAYKNNSLSILDTEPENNNPCAVREPSARLGIFSCIQPAVWCTPCGYNVNQPNAMEESSGLCISITRCFLRALLPIYQPISPSNYLVVMGQEVYRRLVESMNLLHQEDDSNCGTESPFSLHILSCRACY